MSVGILTIPRYAEYFKVTEKTIYGLSQKQKVPRFKVDGQWRFRREELDAGVDERQGELPQEKNE